MNRAEFFLERLSGRTLDVGYCCGTLHSRIVEKFGRQNVYGLDTETKEESEHYRRGSAEKIPFPNASFESVAAGELIEHLARPEKFIREANRILRKGGMLLISTPNRKSWVNRMTGSYNTSVHKSLFASSELFALLEKNGFSVESFRCLPYSGESSYGSRHKWSFPFRALVHSLLPPPLQEEMLLAARKVKEL